MRFVITLHNINCTFFIIILFIIITFLIKFINVITLTSVIYFVIGDVITSPITHVISLTKTMINPLFIFKFFKRIFIMIISTKRRFF